MGEARSIRGVVSAMMRDVEERNAKEAASLGISVAELRARHTEEELGRKRAWLHEQNLHAVYRTEARVTERDAHMLASGAAQPTKALSHVRAWLESHDRFLVLCGSVGIGKTVAGAAACLLDSDYSDLSGAIGVSHRDVGVVIPAGHLAQRMDPWSADIDAGVTRLNPRAHQRIVLDDLGTERQDQRFAQALFDLVDQRQDVGRTLITTNLTGAQLRERYDERMIDRVLHQGRIVEVRGKSMRGSRGNG